jgi:hypothetical protein
LSDALVLRFDRELKPQMIVQAMHDNQFPLFSCKLETEQISLNNIPSLQLKFVCRNVSTSLAFDVQTIWNGERQDPATALVAAGEAVCPTLIANLAKGGDISKDLSLSYETTFGFRVIEIHNGVIFQGGYQRSMLSGATLKSRRYVRSSPPTVQIDER